MSVIPSKVRRIVARSRGILSFFGRKERFLDFIPFVTHSISLGMTHFAGFSFLKRLPCLQAEVLAGV